MIPQIKDYAIAAINGTLAPGGDVHFARTVGIDDKRAIVGEGFRVLTARVVALNSSWRP